MCKAITGKDMCEKLIRWHVGIQEKNSSNIAHYGIKFYGFDSSLYFSYALSNTTTVLSNQFNNGIKDMK